MKKTALMMLASGIFAVTGARAHAQSEPVPPAPVVAPAPAPGLGEPAAPDYPTPAGMPPRAQPGEPLTQTIPQPLPPASTLNTEGAPAPYAPWAYRAGAAVLVGGGYEDFTNSNLRNMTSGGGAWTARLVAGTRQIIGLEAAYVGATRSIATQGLSTGNDLVSNGVEGALRLNVPFIQGRSLIEPFGFIGLGWQHYTITNASTGASALSTHDDVMTMPVGGGLELAYDMFIADARFTWRETYYNDLMRAQGGNLNTWGLAGQIGLTF